MQAIGTAGDTNILLESGTNELEIVEFSIDGNIYGINVAKVREIIKYPDNIVNVPDAHPSFEGIADIRGRVIPIINLQKHLGSPNEIDKDSAYIIISEFNNAMVGFLCDLSSKDSPPVMEADRITQRHAVLRRGGRYSNS